MGIESTLDERLAVKASNLSKSYQLGELLGLQRMVGTLARSILGKPTEDPFMAVSNLSFEIPKGKPFGIVGRNGAGKSTILQLMAGITVPTDGCIKVRGRILALLEVGAGFHLELTGRENVTLFGTILGLRPQEIERAMPSIAEFAGVEQHIDTPLKRYSTGMAARLSFAVALRFPADIYIFDEVLAVVDDDFRTICVREIKEMIAAGQTIIFISHDLSLVRSLCKEAIWIEKGQLRATGPIDEICNAYSNFHANSDESVVAGQ